MFIDNSQKGLMQTPLSTNSAILLGSGCCCKFWSISLSSSLSNLVLAHLKALRDFSHHLLHNLICCITKLFIILELLHIKNNNNTMQKYKSYLHHYKTTTHTYTIWLHKNGGKRLPRVT